MIVKQTRMREIVGSLEIRTMAVNVCRMAVAAICFLPLFFHFYGYSFNHPELKWKTVESEHFSVHYYDNTAPFVSPAVGTAEEVYASLVALYGFETYSLLKKDKIDIVLADYDDMSNGFADWVGGTVQIWVPDGFFPFRGNSPWLRNVLTHELSHIFSLRKRPGMQMVAARTSAGFHQPGVDISVGKTLPMVQILPMWLAEGLAQRGSARCGNDCWDGRRDMLLRCALLDHKELSLDRMGVLSHDQLGNEQVYNQGFSFVTYLERAIGDKALHALLLQANSQAFDPFAVTKPLSQFELNAARLEQYYRSWRDSATTAARRKLPVRMTETESVWHKGNLNLAPRADPDGGYWGCLTTNNDDSYRTDLIVARRGSAEPLRVIKHALASWDFASKTGFVYFIKSYDPGEHGSFYNELYRCNIANGKTERLTGNGRIYAVAVSPTEREVAVVRFRDGCFSLELFDCSSQTFRTLNRGSPGNPFVAVDYAPGDSSKLVVEHIVNGRSALYLADRGSGSLRPLTRGTAREESPCWAGNGRIYFSADYDGIFNCYSIKPDGSDLLRHTSVKGGAFEPVPENDGAKLLFSEYTSSGFRICRATPDSMPYSMPQSGGCVFSRPARQIAFSPERPYSLHMSRAWWESVFAVDYTADSTSAFQLDAGFLRVQNDALGKFTYLLGLQATVAAANANGGTEASAHMREAVTATRPAPTMVSGYLDSISPGAGNFLSGPLKNRILPGEALETGGQRANQPQVGAFLIPQLGIQSSNLGCTIQSMAAAQLALGVIPILLQSQSSVNWQVGRSSFVGLEPTANVILIDMVRNFLDTTAIDTTFYEPFVLTLPLVFDWQAVGYYNEDIRHNGNGLSQARLGIAPFSVPGKRYLDNYFPRKARGIRGNADFFHGFPITKYTGIPASFSCGADYYDSPVFQTMLNQYTYPFSGNSDLFVKCRATAALAVPLVKSIGGSKNHYDALYAKIGYSCSAIANRSFLVQLQDAGDRWPGILGRNFTSRSPDPGFFASHAIFATAEVNSISSYIFSGGIECTGIFDILSKSYGFMINALF